MSTAYEQLVERCFAATSDAHSKDIRSILAEVFRTLETVTPEMVAAYAEESHKPERGSDTAWASADWLAMLRASPLAPPKEGK